MIGMIISAVPATVVFGLVCILLGSILSVFVVIGAPWQAAMALVAGLAGVFLIWFALAREYVER